MLRNCSDLTPKTSVKHSQPMHAFTLTPWTVSSESARSPAAFSKVQIKRIRVTVPKIRPSLQKPQSDRNIIPLATCTPLLHFTPKKKKTPKQRVLKGPSAEQSGRYTNYQFYLLRRLNLSFELKRFSRAVKPSQRVMAAADRLPRKERKVGREAESECLTKYNLFSE